MRFQRIAFSAVALLGLAGCESNNYYDDYAEPAGYYESQPYNPPIYSYDYFYLNGGFDHFDHHGHHDWHDGHHDGHGVYHDGSHGHGNYHGDGSPH